MSNNCINSLNAKYSFQILYRGTNAERSKLEVGKEPDFPVELEIGLNSAGMPTEMAHMPKTPDSFTCRFSSNKNKPIDTIDIPVNTLLIRYSRDLFTLFSLKKSFELNPTLLDQFREGTPALFDWKSGDLPSKYQTVIEHIVAITAGKKHQLNAIIGHIQKLSEFIAGLEAECNTGISIKFRAQLDAIMKFMIDNTLNYPTAKEFRKIVVSSKQLFEMKVKSVFNRSLKSLCDELKFKNAMYEICFTQKAISDISYDHGYSEPSSFSRSIKARLGLSPRNIRKTTKEGFLGLFTQ